MIGYLTKVNWVDILILILLLRTSYIGFTHGLSYEVITILGIVGSVVIAIHNYRYIGKFLFTHVNLPIEFSNFLGFFILACGTFLVCRYIRILFYRLTKIEIFPTLEKFGGLAFGFMRGSLIASLILICLLLVPNEYIRISIIQKSLAGMTFLKIAPTCYKYTINLFPRFRKSEKGWILKEVVTHESSRKKVRTEINKKIKK